MSRLKSPKLISKLFEPTRVFSALLIAAIIWLYPAIIGGSERQQDSTIGSLIAYPPPLQAFVLTDSAFATDSDSPGRDCGDCYPGCTEWDRNGCNEWGEICDPCAPPPPVYYPPTSSAVLYCSQSVNGWCTGSLSLNLTASDPQGKAIVISGTLNGTTFALPDCPTDPNLCSIPISSEGAGTITYRVESATGLAASGATNYQLDLSTPALNGSLSGTAGINGWYRSNVILNITASDSASGIASTETNTNNAGWTTYSSPITFTDGIYTVAIRTTDKAGYTAQTSQTIQVDSITPTLSTSLSGTSGLNGWYVSNVTITPSAGDPSGGSGLASFEVNVDEGGYIPYSSPILFTDGNHTYQFKASDKAGNVTETAQKTVKVDTLTPSVSTSLSGTSGLNGWFVSNVSITPAVSDPSGGSGLAAFVVSTEGSTYSTYVNPLFFSEGVHTYRFRATDHAGNVTETVQQTVRVDTTTPTISLTITGTLRESGWYVTNVTVTPVVNDLTAGIGSIESSLEGGAWSSVISPPSFSDGLHSYQFKVTDNAGNSTIIPVQNLKIDTIAPAIDMTEELSLGETMVYNLEDHGSGLYIYRAVIEDDDESNEKITWLDDISGNKRMQGQILWDGKFADGAKASWGFNTYFITLKISDIAGNETMKSAVVSVNPLSFLQDIPVFVAPQTTTLPAPVAQTESASSTFGGENNNTIGGGTITTNEGGENNNNINGTEAITTNEGGASFQWPEDAIIESGFSIESLSTNTSPFAPSNILWGAAATALLGATLADWQKKREEEARVRAMTRRERLAAEGAFEEDEKGEGNLRARRDAVKAHDAAVRARWAAQSSSQSTTNAAMERKMAKLDAIDEAKWTASQAVVAQREKDKAAELAGVQAYYEGRKAGEVTTNVPKKDETWLENVWNKAFNNQVELSLGTGIVVGVAAVVAVVAGVITAPAWLVVGGAVVVTAVIVTAGTMALNSHFGLRLGNNLVTNLIVGSAATLITTGVGLLLTSAAPFIGATITNTCANYATACTQIGTIIDKGEEALLAGQLAYYTWTGNQDNAAQTAIELQLEQMDGNVPGNSVANELSEQIAKLGPDAAELIAKQGNDVIPLLLKYGDDAVDIIGAYGDEGIGLLLKFGDHTDEAIALVKKFGTPAVKVLDAVDLTSAKTLLNTLDDDVLDYAITQGPDAIAALSRWSDKELMEFGPELALRAKKDAKVLEDINKLVSLGSIDPKHLTVEQQTLINAIAENSTQYNEEGQIVLGKWVDYGNGFTSYARETGSVHYNPHPDMWDLFGEFGDDLREDTAWLVNKQVIQTGIEKSLPFEYTLNGIPSDNIFTEQSAVQLIFSGATDSEIKSALRVSKLPIRWQELKELQKAGYEFVFDETSNSFIFGSP